MPFNYCAYVIIRQCTFVSVQGLFCFLGSQSRVHFYQPISPMATETLNVSDGTTMQIARLPDIDDATWAEVKDYVEKNPETAKALQNFAKNPEAMRGWLQTQAG